MFKNKSLRLLGSAAMAAALMVPATVEAAGAKPVPAGSTVLSVEGFINHAELGKKLQSIQQSSQGRVKVEVAGTSNRGRAIWKATVGTGKKVILVQSEIHGNEKTGTVALVNILQKLGSNSAEAKKLREEITLVAVPMMNPDASELDRRGNDYTWQEVLKNYPQLQGAQPSWNYYTRVLQGDDYAAKPGFDVNRDFHPDLNYVAKKEDFPGSSNQPGWYITPESKVVRDIYKGLKASHGNVDVFVDLHHQGFPYVEGTDKVVTMSLSGQFVPDPRTPAGAKYSKYAGNYQYDFSRQLNLAAYNALQAKGNSIFTHISLYEQGLDLPGTALGSFALNGSGTVLFEVKGQTQNYGQKMKGQLVKTVETGLEAIIEGYADDSVYKLNPLDYEKIPKSVYTPFGI
ncbi:peptidase M14 [Bacillus lacus]|uniref:Peptidase M14 n=1 Tax=Metabacillus lacus TaxID=1983721 RepID=A0A7X2IZF2_9BACI|nr:M14 family zinc carboxypeptidase [Metabacillus lacus]MRX71983.1 peptidase M14 [Metabacillus lacus]